MGSAWLVAVTVAAAILVAALGGQLLLHRGVPDDPDEPLREPADRLRNILRETVLTPWLALGWPFGQAVAEIPPDTRLAVLVHGFAASPACLWPLGRRLRRDGWAVIAPSLGVWWPDLDRAAARLAEQLDRIQRHRTAGDLVIVAHGLGGLATRLALARAPWLARGLRLVITLGTPHEGTEACATLRVGPFRRDVRPDSATMCALRTSRLPAGVEALAITSPADAMLVPAERARWRDACKVSVAGHGHLFLLVSATVREIVAENLADVSLPAVADHAG